MRAKTGTESPWHDHLKNDERDLRTITNRARIIFVFDTISVIVCSPSLTLISYHSFRCRD
jgi:hypothetical protein